MIGFRINKNVIAVSQMLCEQAMALGRLYPERLTVKLILFRDVRRCESTESFTVFQHDIPSP